MLDIVDRRPSILHITLHTAQSRRSYRQEVDDATIALLRPLVQGDGDYEVPMIPDRRLKVTRSGRLLLATVMAETSICTIGIADQTVGAQKLWQILHEGVKLATTQDRVPVSPWCAIRLESGIADHPEDAQWLPDFERCLAWTWIEHTRRRA
ncbi:hypothetical protein [Beijerinckia indica]|uniref:Uncharacterized protein n=1 Tax=Beijerinckia indica subsp. indica (strain ATCC 9039 / DSM 1715 / NCIMB 8712) TaxID=395963 RepID=B2IDK7_BEII9|nr:hypothetical protein [Beijerinckia indica]ACB95443.1 conserved hypothetical protein [Beijerinckia indica subsp. indica ATCC 9039]